MSKIFSLDSSVFITFIVLLLLLKHLIFVAEVNNFRQNAVRC